MSALESMATVVMRRPNAFARSRLRKAITSKSVTATMKPAIGTSCDGPSVPASLRLTTTTLTMAAMPAMPTSARRRAEKPTLSSRSCASLRIASASPRSRARRASSAASPTTISGSSESSESIRARARAAWPSSIARCASAARHRCSPRFAATLSHQDASAWRYAKRHSARSARLRRREASSGPIAAAASASLSSPVRDKSSDARWFRKSVIAVRNARALG